MSILEHLDKLTPAKEKSKYICPVCEGHNLSINQKTGEYDCYNCGDTQGIWRAIAPSPQNGDRPRSQRKPRKSAKEKDRDVQLNAAQVEAKVDELAIMVADGIHTPEQAALELSTWCKQWEHNDYIANQLLKKKLSQLPIEPDSDESPKLARKFRAIERIWGDRLRLNELTNQIELDGSPVEDSGDLRLTLALDHGVSVTVNDCEAIIKRLAKNNRYHPVKEYLKSVSASQGNDTRILENLASDLFGTDVKIYDTFLKKTLVAAVARIFKPGEKVDTALILQGKQAFNKSTFFKVLAGADWFDDSMGAATSERDERLKLHQFWFLEWAELEAVFKRKDIAAVKAFLTCGIDTVRAPYERTAVSLKRRSIIVGTTNQEEFLTDSTGNRRFWVIPVQKRIDLNRVSQLRDRIWAAAVALYQLGYEWWLNQAEEAIAAEFTEAYRTEDPWIAPIVSYLKENSRGEVTTTELLKHALEIEVGRQGKREEMRVADILKTIGWKAEKRTISGKRRRVWVEPDERGCPDSDKVVPKAETSTQQAIGPSSASPHTGQPGQPPNQVVPQVVQPETPVNKGIQRDGTTWTTSNPKTNSFSQNGKPQSNGHSPPTEIEPMSDHLPADFEPLSNRYVTGSLNGGEPR